MHLHDEPFSQSLTTSIRTPPTIAPEDSLQRFLDVFKQTPYSTLPVTSNGRFCGYISIAEASPILGIEDDLQKEAALHAPVARYMTAPGSVVDAQMDLPAIRALLSELRVEMVAVLDTSGCYAGVILTKDLLTGSAAPMRLPTIGGMATPFGVYLTDGTLQGGVGNLALAAGGAVLALCTIAAGLLVQGVIDAGGAMLHRDVGFLSPEYEAPAGSFQLGMLAVGLHLLTTLVFLILIRASRIAGYHAAEHQTVHALEHGEPLTREIVARMPRPHPRCGTNILAAALLFWNFSALLRAMPGMDADSSAFIAVIITVFFWRRVGTMLQAVFTTRPASARELESGISAARSLISRYRQAPPHRTRPLRRIWCSGLLQSLAGMAPVLMLLGALLSRWLH